MSCFLFKNQLENSEKRKTNYPPINILPTNTNVAAAVYVYSINCNKSLQNRITIYSNCND